jgi:hypothetical protein
MRARRVGINSVCGTMPGEHGYCKNFQNLFAISFNSTI